MLANVWLTHVYCGQAVSVSGNRLRDFPEILPATLACGYSNLRRLVVNQVGLTDGDVLNTFCNVFENLSELYVAKNDQLFKQGCTTGGAWKNLKILDVSECGIKDWGVVRTICKNMDGLESLVLNENEIKSVEAKEEGEFNTMQALQVGSESELGRFIAEGALHQSTLHQSTLHRSAPPPNIPPPSLASVLPRI